MPDDAAERTVEQPSDAAGTAAQEELAAGTGAVRVWGLGGLAELPEVEEGVVGEDMVAAVAV